MKTLEEIYQTYFDCKVPFRKSGRLTKEGALAHDRLIDLITDLVVLGVIEDDERICSMRLDEIANEGISYKQEMVNDLKRFVTGLSEEYKLDTPVTVELDGKKFNFMYFTQDYDYNDIFMAEKTYEEDAENEIYDFTTLDDENAKKVFNAIVSQEIEKGWDWKEHAKSLLKDKFESVSELEIYDFIETYWCNLATDAENVENFQNQP